MYEIGKYTAGIIAGFEIAKSISSNFAEQVYPEDIFPPDGKSLDCKSAKMARVTCKNIADQIDAYIESQFPDLWKPES